MHRRPLPGSLDCESISGLPLEPDKDSNPFSVWDVYSTCAHEPAVVAHFCSVIHVMPEKGMGVSAGIVGHEAARGF